MNVYAETSCMTPVRAEPRDLGEHIGAIGVGLSGAGGTPMRGKDLTVLTLRRAASLYIW